MAAKQVRSSKGIFVPKESCATNNKHHEWHIDDNKVTLKRMRDLPAQLVETLCEAGGINTHTKILDSLHLNWSIIHTMHACMRD